METYPSQGKDMAPTQLDEIDSIISELASSFERLEMKLSPVRTPTPESSLAQPHEAPHNRLASFYQQLRDLNIKINVINQELNL